MLQKLLQPLTLICDWLCYAPYAYFAPYAYTDAPYMYKVSQLYVWALVLPHTHMGAHMEHQRPILIWDKANF